MPNESDIPSWQSLIGDRMRVSDHDCRVEDPVRRNRVRRSRRWHENHPNYGADYYAEHKEKMLASSKAWKLAHPEAVRASRKAWREANPEKVKESARKSREKRKQQKLLNAA